MHSHADGSYLLPEMMAENSRFSTPRSSVGDGISTDCDADVESNMSGNSEKASPHRRRSSYGIYGIVPANRATMLANQAEKLQKASQRQESVASAWNNMAVAHKLAFVSSIVILIVMLFGFVFLFPGCQNDCERNNSPKPHKVDIESKWPLVLHNVLPQSKILLIDINDDNENDLVGIFRQNVSIIPSADKFIAGNSSFIIAVDGKTAVVLKKIYLDFPPFWMHVESNDNVNGTCFVVSTHGILAKVFISTEIVVWKSQPCSEIHSVLMIKDIDFDSKQDLLVVCSWVSAADAKISGIALVSSATGELIGSKIRYQLGQTPSSFLMQHMNAKNETCILFGTQRHGKSTVLAVRLKRLMEIATGTRNKVNLVSENPLVVAKNVRTDVETAYEDISGDGVKDIGFVLQHGMISFIDGATLTLRKTIDARHGKIIKISVLLATSFSRPLLAVMKRTTERCGKATLNIYDFRNAFDPYVIDLPFSPLIVAEANLDKKKCFIFWNDNDGSSCPDDPMKRSTNDSQKKEPENEVPTREIEYAKLPFQDSSINDIAEDIDIDAIDKDVLDNLREYVGIDDKGVTRHHKLFHLVCNYLLLRFLISYGITTDSVLRDFKSTRNHLLNLSNRNLGRALTDQLKGLLAADYDKDVDIPPWFDDVENDVDWLKDDDNKNSVKTKRDVDDVSDAKIGNWESGSKVSLATLDGNELSEETWKESLSLPEPLKRMLDKDDIVNMKWASDIQNLLSGGVKDRELLKQFTNPPGYKEEGKESSKLEQGSYEPGLISPSVPCYLPELTFKILEISKMSYRWSNITVNQNKETTKETSNPSTTVKTEIKKIECAGVSKAVHDIVWNNGYLYYTVIYSHGPLQDRVITQINRIKFDNLV